MYAKIVGLGAVLKGEGKKSGKPYHGQSVHLLYRKSGVDGSAVKEQFVSFLNMDKPPVFKLNEDVFLDFDDKGFLLGIETVAPTK